MAVRSSHSRKSRSYWVNRNRHYEFDTFNSDLESKLAKLTMSSFKRPAQNFDKQFDAPADKLECYIVTKKNGKYIIEKAARA